MKRTFTLLALTLIIALPAVLSAATPEERIATLERQLADMQRTYMNNNQGVASAIAGAQTMQDEWGAVKGQVEGTRQMMASQYQEFSRQMAELEHRVQSIEDRLTIFSEQLSKALGKVAPAVAEEGDLYQQGLDLANQAKYLEAAAAFEKFLQKYDKSQFAPSARAWVGECFYMMRDYQRAIKEYQRFIEKYPHDKNVPVAMLKQGSSFYELGMHDEAKAFLQKVVQSYPSTPAANEAKAKLKLIDDKQARGSGAASGSNLGSYPSETLEQKQKRMRGDAAPPATPPPSSGF